jgi:hypothetical protein
MSGLFNEASLVLVPSGYKSGKVYSQVPTDGDGDLTFTRASSATRVNSDGLIEIPRTNLALRSEEFDNATWVKDFSSVTANTTTSPDGTTNADTYTGNGGSNVKFIYQANSVNSGTTYSISVYAKKNTNNFLQINTATTPFGVNAWANFNLDSGVVGTVGSSATASIQNVGNGWYRCVITAPAVATGTYASALFTLITSATSVRAESNTLSTSVFLWGAQLEVGSTATEYIPTTNSARTTFAGITQDGTSASNVPRLDYSQGSCPALLLEPQRTNDFIRSENLFTTHLVQNLTTSGNVDVATSPDGTQNADKFVPNSTSGVHGIANGSSLAITSGQKYSFSAFVKSDGGAFNLISLTFDSTTAWGATKNCIFNASTGASYSVPSEATMSSQNMGNGWYRITATLTAVGSRSASQYQYRIYIANTSGNLSYAASSGNTAGIYVWGAQVEEGAYATSYIPTTSATVTRLADACSKTGISSLIGQTEGVMFYDGFYGNNPNEVYMFLEQTLASGTSNAIFVQQFSNTIRFNVNTSTQQAQIISSSYNIGQRIKIAAAYKSNDFVMYINGVQIGTDTSGSVPTCTRLQIGTYPADPTNPIFIPNKGVNQAVLFPTRLSNAELQSLTTL